MVFVAKSVRIVIETLFLRFTTNEVFFSTTAMEILLLIRGKRNMTDGCDLYNIFFYLQ